MGDEQTVLAGLSEVRSWQEDFYRHLHQHPELSHQEHETAAAVAERLRGDGFEVHEGLGGTGVVGILRHGEGPTVLLRADMDALPVREATGLPYASEATLQSRRWMPPSPSGRPPVTTGSDPGAALRARR